MPRPAFAPWLSETNEVTKIFLAAAHVPDLVNMAGGLPDPSIWPVDEIAEITAAVVRTEPAVALAYGPIEGLPALRDLLAARFSRGDLGLTRDNILVTTGGMQALSLVGAVFGGGATIAAQTPAYLGALDAWRPQSPRYRPMRLEAPSFDPHAALAGVSFGYVVPNFSNPTGRLVGLEQRRALVAAAQATDTWLVEDDPYGTLHYDAAPLPRLLDLAARGGRYDGPVIYLGTLSKELAPGLRIGWVVAAPQVIAALAAAKQGADMCTSSLCQAVTLAAFDRRLPERMLPQILALYRERRDALCRALSTHLADSFTFDVPPGGMFVWATARDPRLDTDALLRAGLSHGVCVSPSSAFDPEGRDRRSLRINFTLNPPERLEEGVRRLTEAVAWMEGRAAA